MEHSSRSLVVPLLLGADGASEAPAAPRPLTPTAAAPLSPPAATDPLPQSPVPTASAAGPDVPSVDLLCAFLLYAAACVALACLALADSDASRVVKGLALAMLSADCAIDLYRTGAPDGPGGRPCLSLCVGCAVCAHVATWGALVVLVLAQPGDSALGQATGAVAASSVGLAFVYGLTGLLRACRR